MARQFRVRPGCSVLLGSRLVHSGGIFEQGEGDTTDRWLAEQIGNQTVEAVSAVEAGNSNPAGENKITVESPVRTPPIPIGTKDDAKESQVVQVSSTSSTPMPAVNTAPNPAVDLPPASPQNPATPVTPVTTTGGTPVASVTTSPATNQPSMARTSIWDVDPATLQGKKLIELNAMIAERDNTVKAMDTKAEAIALLSKDFRAAK